MAETALAAVLVGPQKFEIREFDLPEIEDDAAIMKMEACGICGSDIGGSSFRNGNEHIMGHEPVGLVYKAGNKFKAKYQVKEGDRIALEEYVPCGACKYCRSNDFRFCAQTDSGSHTGDTPRLWYGSTPLNVWPSLWGGYSQYMYVHPNATVHRIPNNIPAQHAAAFLPFSNGVEWAYGYGGVSLGDAIWIQGPGQQGLAGVIAAKAAGAEKIIVSGLTHDQRRLEVAKKLGATDTLYADQEEDIVKRIMDITGGDGCNVVVNVTGGGKDCVAQSIAVAAKTKANIVLAAAGPEVINMGSLGRKKIVLKRANGHSFQAVELAIQFIADGNLPMEDISTHTFPMSRAAEAIDAVAGRPGAAPGAIHVSILPEV
jgi:threonine dehydrogenase-like Zn-dependent dehydrogenase